MTISGHKWLFVFGFVLGGMQSGQAGQDAIRIKGSDTMLRLNENLARTYASKFHQAVAVTGGGTSVGIDALFSGNAEICSASRRLNATEIKVGIARNFQLLEVPVALDGLAIAVSATNPVKRLTTSQVRDIFVGKITNWKQVGGKDAEIVAFARDRKSGTHAFLQEEVLRGKPWGKSVRFLPSTTEEVRELLRQPNGITFGGVAYFSGRLGVQVLAISSGQGKAYTHPSSEMVVSRKYPIWRFLYFIANGASSPKVRDFIKWSRSAEGQSVVQESGFYRIDQR